MHAAVSKAGASIFLSLQLPLLQQQTNQTVNTAPKSTISVSNPSKPRRRESRNELESVNDVH